MTEPISVSLKRLQTLAACHVCLRVIISATTRIWALVVSHSIFDLGAHITLPLSFLLVAWSSLSQILSL